MFEPDSLTEISGLIEALTPVPDIFVTAPAEHRAEIEEHFARTTLPVELITANDGGGDAWPFLEVLARDVPDWDLVLKLHNGRPGHRDDETYAGHLAELLNPDVHARVITAFGAEPMLGMVHPAVDRATDSYRGANDVGLDWLARRLGIEGSDVGDSRVAPSMFYVRSHALAPLRAIQLDVRDSAAVGLDEALETAVRRCFPLSVAAAGLSSRDTRETAGPPRDPYANVPIAQ